MKFIWTYLITNNHYLSIIGILTIFLLAFVFSSAKKNIKPHKIATGLLMQFLIAFFILNTKIGLYIFHQIALGFNKLNSFADQGIKFVFGNLAKANSSWGYIFGIKVLPIIVFFGALMALLYHIGVIQLFVKGLNFLISPLLGTSGAETLCASANSMLDPSASALLIKNQLKWLTDSEMLAVMISGMSTLTASLIAVYGSMGIPMLHLLTASIMSIPGSLIISKILMPETDFPKTSAGKKISLAKDSDNLLDAISKGTTSGLNVAFSVGAMLIVFIGLIGMLNFLLIKITGIFFTPGYGFNDLLGKAFSWIMYLIGIPSQDTVAAGALLGQKIALNEFIAYASLLKVQITARSSIIMTYAICGFSNFSVIGILIGAIGSMAPLKREFLTKYGFKALLGGTLVNLLNAAIASLFL
ncbi:NupC/NupG family nucleoside CNT transporter [Candidatus Dependentiae bacterium]|nr:NupC/NupG family nucleoside CNT transporter [Candidatus Dependentiae bacterium]